MIHKVKGFDDLIKDNSLFDKDYFYNVETFINLTDDYLQEFEKVLLKHPEYETLKANFIIDKENKRLIQIHEKIPFIELEDLNDEERFFYPLCSKQEIKRIFNVKNSLDYLLKFRAEQVIDNQRLNRVYNYIRRKQGSEWNFSQYFDSLLFETYLEYLPQNEKNVCQQIPHGTIHLHEANGYCIKTPFGNVIVISQALRQFLYYMNLFHFGEHYGFKKDEILPTFILATRIMLGTEALDFEIDSRGEIPIEIHTEIDLITEWQMLFVIGHEYAHHYLNHLDKSNTINITEANDGNFKFYTFKQKYELDADFNSIINQNISDEERSVLTNSAFLFFQWLDLFTTVREYMFPSFGRPSSHPDPIDRIHELRKRLDEKYGFSKKELQEQIKYYKSFKEKLIKDYLPFNIEQFETYGSVYLESYKKERTHDRLL
jgi:hypothetical protein